MIRYLALSMVVILGILLSSCQGLPTLDVTATAAPTTLPTALVPTATAMIVQIIGDVYVRDDQGKVMGWLYKNDKVQAACSGDWCRISSGSYGGYLFWRGCSSDNPEHRSCQAT
jgi:hypothetical protein